MSVSCSAFFTPTLWQYDGHPGRIRGWRFRGIPEIHSQKPFKFFYAFLQHCDTLFQCRVFFFQLFYICVLVHKTVIEQGQMFTKVYFNYSKLGERLRIFLSGIPLYCLSHYTLCQKRLKPRFYNMNHMLLSGL